VCGSGAGAGPAPVGGWQLRGSECRQGEPHSAREQLTEAARVHQTVRQCSVFAIEVLVSVRLAASPLCACKGPTGVNALRRRERGLCRLAAPLGVPLDHAILALLDR